MKKYIFYVVMLNLVSQANTLFSMNRHSSSFSDSDQVQRPQTRRETSRKQKEIEDVRAQAKALQEAQEDDIQRRLEAKNDIDAQRLTSITSSAAAQAREQFQPVSAKDIERLDHNLQTVAQQVNDFQDDMEERFERQERLLAEIRAMMQEADTDTTLSDFQDHAKK